VTGRGGVDVRFKGRTKIGFPLEERDRHGDGTHFSERTTELVKFSDAPIPAAVFEIPDGYQPALQLPLGSYDLSRPDTIWNRASTYWSLASGWVQQWWR